jgi:UDP-N-acetylglucosamine 4,6-dehydratase (inverting)
MNLNGKSILITGGTGSFGQAFVKYVFENYPDVKKLAIYSRDELKQFDMSEKFNEKDYPAIRYYLGDVRDLQRLKFALEDIDIVIHAAALKQVPAAEYNPFEFIKTNIMGAQNIVDACLSTNVKKVVALSTDKAAAPINLYGATKLCSDKIFSSSNFIKGNRDYSCSIVRYGNVMGSRGSVIPFFLKLKNKDELPITHESMTRFNITLDEGIQTVMWALKNTVGGEIVVPKIPSYNILDVAKAISPNSKINVIGIRPGEKLHEVMITETDSLLTVDYGDYYGIIPDFIWDDYLSLSNVEGVSKILEPFTYDSYNNQRYLSIDELKDLIERVVEPYLRDK